MGRSAKAGMRLILSFVYVQSLAALAVVVLALTGVYMFVPSLPGQELASLHSYVPACKPLTNHNISVCGNLKGKWKYVW